MKISVHIEADSYQEFHSIVSAMAGTQAVARVVDEETTALAEAPVAEAPVAEAPVVEVPVAEAPLPAEKPPVERKTRARRTRQAAPVETAPAAPPAVESKSGNGGAAQLAPVTRDDFNAACREYVIRYGMNFAQVDAPKLLQPVFGERIRRTADVEEKDLPQAIVIMNKAVDENPFNRKRADG